MDELLAKNLLGRSSADDRPVIFDGDDTIRSHVTHAAAAVVLSNLAVAGTIAYHANKFHNQFAEDAARRHQQLLDADREAYLESCELERSAYLERQALFGLTPALERKPGESDKVFELKELAAAEFRRDYSR